MEYETVVMNNLVIDETIKHVKNIVQNIECPLCDETDGQRLRYSCGHTVCDVCVNDAVDCQICSILPQICSPQPRLDIVLTQRVQNTLKLLKNCQDLFNTNVLRNKRLSEKLKIEKEVFPECIQAPVKYENKRKSTIFSYKNKENSNYIFPGEDILVPHENITMENSLQYVQQWLNKTDKDFTRKPFRDLNLNTQLGCNVNLPKNRHKGLSTKDENVSIAKSNSKKSHFKMIEKNNHKSQKSTKLMTKNNVTNSMKVNKRIFNFNTHPLTNNKNIDCDNNESGIFMDDTIVIDDSQELVIDKDKNAWLAVLEANKHEEIESTSLTNNSNHKAFTCINKLSPSKTNGLQNKVNYNFKVPFYKKSYITEPCMHCNTTAINATGITEKVKITIENDNFTTTIQVIDDAKTGFKLNTNSVSVQTDIVGCMPGIANTIVLTSFNKTDCYENVHNQKSDAQSEDLFDLEGQNFENEYKRNECLVIAESDSDIELEGSGPLPIKVDVHRSCDKSDYGILSEIDNIGKHDSRTRRRPRGHTPTSTDSSEKENYNPNRLKRHLPKKSKYSKK